MSTIVSLFLRCSFQYIFFVVVCFSLRLSPVIMPTSIPVRGGPRRLDARLSPLETATAMRVDDLLAAGHVHRRFAGEPVRVGLDRSDRALPHQPPVPRRTSSRPRVRRRGPGSPRIPSPPKKIDLSRRRALDNGSPRCSRALLHARRQPKNLIAFRRSTGTMSALAS